VSTLPGSGRPNFDLERADQRQSNTIVGSYWSKIICEQFEGVVQGGAWERIKANLVHRVFKRQLWSTKCRRSNSSGSRIRFRVSPLR
jgi:hypothetical protein